MTGTQEPLAVHFELDGRQIVLIDTPGFDDDMRSDVQILEDISKWLAKKGYLRQPQLDALIFLHPMTLNRVGGAGRNRTRLIEKILGQDAYKRVIIATTMWEDIRSEDTAQARLQGRVGTGGVWHEMCSKGATRVRHDNNHESAHRIIREVIQMSKSSEKMKPLLQSELKTLQGRVVHTSAGKELKKQLEDDILRLRNELAAHKAERPPEAWRKEKDRELRNEWRAWQESKRNMEERLALREIQLKRLGSLVVSKGKRRVRKVFCFGWC